jgi:hypothetical protein
MLQLVVLCGVLLVVARPAVAEPNPKGVGLGVGLGLSVPWGEIREGTQVRKLHPNYSWGFYVNIPLISSFHLMPHAELYQLNGNTTATDIGMAFKFIVEGTKFRPYFGLNIGGTNVISSLRFNAGALLGSSFNLYKNLDAFLEGRYMVIMRDVPEGGNIRNLHVIGGLLFRF